MNSKKVKFFGSILVLVIGIILIIVFFAKETVTDQSLKNLWLGILSVIFSIISIITLSVKTKETHWEISGLYQYEVDEQGQRTGKRKFADSGMERIHQVFHKIK